MKDRRHGTSSRCLLLVLAPVTVELDHHASVARINQLFRNPSVRERVHRDLKGVLRTPDDLLIDDREILLRRKVKCWRVDFRG